MEINYPLSVLYGAKNNLQDRLTEINDGNYNNHPQKMVKKLKTDITHKLQEIEFAIEVLETYLD